MTATVSRIHLVSEGVLASYIQEIASPRPTAEAPKPAPVEEIPCNPG
jgi:hypothetical protein